MLKSDRSKSAGDHAPRPEEEYRARLAEVIRKEDYCVAATLKAQQTLAQDGSAHDDDDDGEKTPADSQSEGEKSAASSEVNAHADSTRVLRMLYKGSTQEVARKEETARKGKTWVTSVAQEATSVHPGAGAVNIQELAP